MSDTFPFPVLVSYSQRAATGGPRPPRSVPWDFVEPHEQQALENHRQDLETLARRGGLSPQELYYVCRDEPYAEDVSFEHAVLWPNAALRFPPQLPEPGDVTFTVSKEQLDALVEKAVLQEVRTRLPNALALRGILREQLDHIAREVLSDYMRGAAQVMFEKAATSWLDARSGRVARQLRRATKTE